MYNPKKMQEFIDEAFVEMFRRVGQTYDFELLKEQEWFRKHQWDTKTQDEFKTWLIALLRKKFKMRKTQAEREAVWFILNYGWVVRD